MLAAVDCTKEKSLAKKFDIGGYPTSKLNHVPISSQILLFRQGGVDGHFIYHYICMFSWTYLPLVILKKNLIGRFLVIFFFCLTILFFPFHVTGKLKNQTNKQLNTSGKTICLVNTLRS